MWIALLWIALGLLRVSVSAGITVGDNRQFDPTVDGSVGVAGIWHFRHAFAHALLRNPGLLDSSTGQISGDAGRAQFGQALVIFL